MLKEMPVSCVLPELTRNDTLLVVVGVRVKYFVKFWLATSEKDADVAALAAEPATSVKESKES